ncbi:MAG: HU family DNA-binding protein [Dysgonamonadaceae bacterium]|jgi:nucleoid DNA-binding protein|nr:HU family DNA-binding protein [Dysgonamonadaceae bacterium]
MNEKINIQELTTLLSEELKITKKEADGFLRELFYVMHEGLLRDNLLKIKDLGSFKIIDVSDRESINVRTGQRLTIPAHRKLSYTPDPSLKERVNVPATTPSPVVEEEHREPVAEIAGRQPAPSPSQSQSGEDVQFGRLYNETQKKLTFPARHPLLIVFVLILLGSLIFYGIYRFITSSNRKEYRSTLIKFNTKARTTGTDDDVIEYDPSTPPDTEESFLPVEPRKIKTKYGEKLSSIAFREYGDEIFWVYLYEANRHVVKNPDNIPPDTEIIIPDAEVYGLNKYNLQAVEKATQLAGKIRKELGE